MKKKILKSSLILLGLFLVGTSTKSLANELESNEITLEYLDENHEFNEDEDGAFLIKENEAITLKEAEDLLFKYFEDNNLNYELYSEQFSNYVLQQIMDEDDVLLKTIDYYPSIYVYMSKYLSLSQDYQFENETLEGFSMSPYYEMLTNEILEQNEEENINAEFEAQNQIRPRVGIWGDLRLSKAKAYAKKHYKNRNSSYKNFGSNDCTNFVSQILVAADNNKNNQSFPSNWKKQKDIYGTSKYWYHKKDGKKFKVTTSFIRVPDFYTYWAMNKREFAKKDWKKAISYATAGDLVQYKDKSRGWYHTSFIYKKDKNNLYVSQHSSDALERKLSDQMSSSTAIRVLKTYMK